MPISNYSELQVEIADFLDRTDITAKAPTLITLAEAKLNRLLDLPETDAPLTGIVGSRRIDIAALALKEPVGLFLETTGLEQEITLKQDGTFPYSAVAGCPAFYAIDGENIDFDKPLDSAYTFRFRISARFALSGAIPTNDLLLKHPDVYLAAAIMWGGIWTVDIEKAGGYKALLDEFLAETRHAYSKKKRGTLSPDRALAAMTSAR
ncbi:MAG: hypothetical protein COA78_17265 [Blastopirellula sp.]|nr:MAG: hypothetical protein COA78_17265 [Blastopirellula sp.]